MWRSAGRLLVMYETLAEEQRAILYDKAAQLLAS
jgi:hypothetical protein